MLSPKRVKHRKQQKGNMTGLAYVGCNLDFGDFGLQVVEPGRLTNRQIEAARIAISRHVKRGGKLWIRIFPDKPLTTKPAETRMGSGKGSPEKWVAEVRAGRIMYEMTGVTLEVAEAALQRAASKLPIRTKIIQRSESLI